MKAFGSLKCFILHFLFCSLKIDILLREGLLHSNIFYQYLVDYLLNLLMHLFFLIQNLLLLIICVDDLEYMLLWIMFYFVFISIIIKINHLYLLSISFSHNVKAFVPYGYVIILSKVYNLLSYHFHKL